MRQRSARILGVAGLLAVLAGGIVVRAVELAVVQGPTLAREATSQHVRHVRLRPQRGPIVDRAGHLLAHSVDMPSIAAWPKEFRGQEDRIPALATALGMKPKALQTKLDGARPFVWLRRRVAPRVKEAVQELRLRGVGFFDEGRRFYPHGVLAAHVLGAVGIDGRGQYGLEQKFDRDLRGDERVVTVDRDVGGGAMATGGLESTPLQGSRIELTLDADVQAATERELALGVAEAKAAAGAAIVLDTRTGEVLALANVPTYNPNAPSGSGGDFHRRLRNRAVQDQYEPGSTFKALVAAAALEEGVTTPTENFDCENGSWAYATTVVHDAHPHGILSFAQVIQYSSNIGAAKVGNRLGKERLYKYFRAFGIGRRTGIELPDEGHGHLRPVQTWAQVDVATSSYGQGVAVTPLQMAAAFGAIANGGVLMKPYLVRRIVAPTGEVVVDHQPTPVGRVVSDAVARKTTELLRLVVEKDGGTGTKARLADFPVAGKTGTAQKPKVGGRGYDPGRVIGSFVGYVPADDPRLVIVVVVDEPQAAHYGGVVAAPIFKAIAQAALPLEGIHPAAPSLPSDDGLVPVLAALAPPPPATLVGETTGTASFLGLSLREALGRARSLGYDDVQLEGSGYVRAQQPPPGTPIPPEKRLALVLGYDTGVGRP